MFYRPHDESHGLPYDPFKSCVVPRPIGWISTQDINGHDNLAPYSQFTNLSFDPPMVMFSANQTTDARQKDTAANARATGFFTWNMATWDLREAVNISGQEVPPGQDEFQLAGLEKAQGRCSPVPRVAESPVQFECAYMQTVSLPGGGKMGSVDVVFGRVVGIHIDDKMLTDDGKLDILRIRPIARMGYYDYTVVESSFEMVIPNSHGLLKGLEGQT